MRACTLHATDIPLPESIDYITEWKQYFIFFLKQRFLYQNRTEQNIIYLTKTT